MRLVNSKLKNFEADFVLPLLVWLLSRLCLLFLIAFVAGVLTVMH